MTSPGMSCLCDTSFEGKMAGIRTKQQEEFVLFCGMKDV
jgi:hypothetical protein